MDSFALLCNLNWVKESRTCNGSFSLQALSLECNNTSYISFGHGFSKFDGKVEKEILNM